MSIDINNYRDLYNHHITRKVDSIIVKYNPQKSTYEYRPHSHKTGSNALNDLAELLIDNMIFYAFSETEVTDLHSRHQALDNLKTAAIYAFKTRIPKRNNPDTDGTPGEVLLDLLIQAYEPTSQKLIARAKYRQMGDNSEIKGYDAMYFTKSKNQILLWLGQVKTGQCKYCKTGIMSDLQEKYVDAYFENSVCYVSEKKEPNHPLTDILNGINGICFDSITNSWSPKKKRQKIFQFLKTNHIKIMIPCLLAYTAAIYSNEHTLKTGITECTQDIMNHFSRKKFDICREFDYEILFYVFPIENVQYLRKKISSYRRRG